MGQSDWTGEPSFNFYYIFLPSFLKTLLVFNLFFISVVVRDL